MFARYVLALTLSLASFAVLAKQPYVDLEQHLTEEQLHATGLDTLSPEQLQLLNNLLRDDVAKATEAGKAEARENNEPGRGAASLIGFAVLDKRRPHVLGTVLGAIFVGVLLNGLTMLNAPYYTQDFVKGVVLVGALALTFGLGKKKR